MMQEPLLGSNQRHQDSRRRHRRVPEQLTTIPEKAVSKTGPYRLAAGVSFISAVGGAAVFAFMKAPAFFLTLICQNQNKILCGGETAEFIDVDAGNNIQI